MFEEWYDQLGGDASPLADAIIDRIAHDSYRINITSIDPEHHRSMCEVYGLDKALREYVKYILSDNMGSSLLQYPEFPDDYLPWNSLVKEICSIFYTLSYLTLTKIGTILVG